MKEVIGSGLVNVVIDETGTRLWVCTEEEGTILRAKASQITLDDRRLRNEEVSAPVGD